MRPTRKRRGENVHVWIIRALIVVAVAAVGLMVLWTVSRPRPLTWKEPVPIDPQVKAERVQKLPVEMEPWLVLLPERWMRWSLRQMQWVAGVLLAGITFAITFNPLSALAFGWIGFWLPEIVLRDAAWSRWTAIDRAAYQTVYSVRFYLEQGVPVLETWRSLTPQAQPAFRQWVEPCLISETDGRPFEQTLKTQAMAIHHAELSVTADILSAQRRHGGAIGSLAQVLTMWGKRIELDADRRGSLTGFVWMGRLTLGAGIVLFWGLALGDATIRTHMHTWTGGIVTGFSALLIAIGLTLYHRQNRQAERF